MLRPLQLISTRAVVRMAMFALLFMCICVRGTAAPKSKPDVRGRYDAEGNTSTHSVETWIRSLNVTLPNLNVTVLKEKIRAEDLSCANFEVEVESSLDADGRSIQIHLASLSARCLGTVRLNDKTSVVEIFLLDSTKADLGMELVGTRSAKSTQCKMSAHVDARFTGAASGTLNFLWPLAKPLVAEKINTLVCDLWNGAIENNVTAIMGQIDDLLMPHEKPSPSFPPPELPAAGGEYVRWKDLAVMEALNCFGAEAVVKAVDSVVDVLTQGKGIIVVDASSTPLGKVNEIALGSIANVSLALKTIAIGGLDTLSELAVVPSHAFDQTLATIFAADRLTAGANLDVIVTPLNATISGTSLGKTVDVTIEVDEPTANAECVVAISETVLSKLAPTQWIDPGCILDTVFVVNATKLAMNVSDASVRLSLEPTDPTGDQIAALLNDLVSLFNRAYETAIVEAASNLVDTNVRTLLDEAVATALESLNRTLTCEPRFETPVVRGTRSTRDDNVAHTLEAMLQVLSVNIPAIHVVESGSCVGNFYDPSTSLIASLTDIRISNLSLADLSSSSMPTSPLASSLRVDVGSVGLSLDLAWDASLRSEDSNVSRALTSGSVSMWVEAFGDVDVVLARATDGSPFAKMSACNFGMHDLQLHNITTRAFPHVDTKVLDGLTGILAQMVGAQIGPLLCANLTTTFGTKATPIAVFLDGILDAIDAMPLPSSEPPKLPHNATDGYYVSWSDEPLVEAILNRVTEAQLVNTINTAARAVFDGELDVSLPSVLPLRVALGSNGSLALNVTGVRVGGLDTLERLRLAPDVSISRETIVAELGMRRADLKLDAELELRLPFAGVPVLSNGFSTGVELRDFEIGADIFAAVSSAGLKSLSLGQMLEFSCLAGNTDALNVTRMIANISGGVRLASSTFNPSSALESNLALLVDNTLGFVESFWGNAMNAAIRYAADAMIRDSINTALNASISNSAAKACEPKDAPQDLLTLVETPTGRSMTIEQMLILVGVCIVVIIVLALCANRLVVPHKDVDHAVPKPTESAATSTSTPLRMWGLPENMKGVPRTTTLYIRVRKWLPLAMSFPLKDGWLGYFIRVLFPFVIGLAIALRAVSLILNVMNVDVQIFEDDTMEWSHRVVSFAFQTLLQDFWESKAEILAIFIALSSAVVPVTNILTFLCLWILPFNPKWRGRVFKFADVTSKFTFVSEVFLALIMISFSRIDLHVGSTRVRMRTQPGKAIVTGLVGTMVVKFLSHFLMVMHNFRIGRGRPSMLLVRRFFGADESSRMSQNSSAGDARPSSQLLVRRETSLLRQDLGEYSRWVRYVVIFCLMAIPALFASMASSTLVTAHYAGLVGEAMDDFNVETDLDVTLFDLFTKLADATDEKSIAYFMSFSMAMIMLVIPIVGWASLAVLWLCPIRSNRALVHLAAFCRALYGWNALDALFFALFVTKLELHLVGNWILADRVPTLCDAVNAQLGEQCLQLSVTFGVGFWLLTALLTTFLPLMLVTFFFEDKMIRRREFDDFGVSVSSSSAEELDAPLLGGEADTESIRNAVWDADPDAERRP